MRRKYPKTEELVNNLPVKEVKKPLLKDSNEKVFDISKISINLKCKNENQKKFLHLIGEKEIIIAAGYAGTGKSILACMKSLQLLKEGKYKKIILIKSMTTLRDQELGHLPGSIDDKMMGAMFSFMYNFHKLIGEENTTALIENGYIQIIPLAFIRGLSIDDSIIIADELQNLSLDVCQTLLTRIGFNSKLIGLGDERQIDLRNKKTSSLSFIFEKFSNLKHDDIGTIRFTKEDIVRNKLIKIIEDIFDENTDKLK